VIQPGLIDVNCNVGNAQSRGDSSGKILSLPELERRLLVARCDHGHGDRRADLEIGVILHQTVGASLVRA
jgi:hypothetical protein